MLTDASIFQIVGGIVMAVGAIIFVRRSDSGANTIRLFGIEITVSTPSILIFLAGAMLFVFPFTSLFKSRDKPGGMTLPVDNSGTPAPDTPGESNISDAAIGNSTEEQPTTTIANASQLADNVVLPGNPATVSNNEVEIVVVTINYCSESEAQALILKNYIEQSYKLSVDLRELDIGKGTREVAPYYSEGNKAGKGLAENLSKKFSKDWKLYPSSDSIKESSYKDDPPGQLRVNYCP